MGIPRSDERLKVLDAKLHFAVRTDRSGRVMTDFHTVQTENGNFPNAAGDKRPGNTIITKTVPAGCRIHGMALGR